MLQPDAAPDILRGDMRCVDVANNNALSLVLDLPPGLSVYVAMAAPPPGLALGQLIPLLP